MSNLQTAFSAMPYRILIADDDQGQREIMREILAMPKFQVIEAADGAQAWDALREYNFDAVLLDKQMPGLDGIEVCRRIRSRIESSLLPVIMITGASSPEDIAACLADGATDFIRKPYYAVELRARVESAASRKRLTDQLDSAEAVLFTLARIVEAKDSNTGDHCSRLSRNSMLFGAALGLGAKELLALRRGGVLHDIGKLGIPDSILLKPGPLTEAEWVLMRSHTAIGAELVKDLPSMRLTMPIIRHHHERWDGAGYPDGLQGEAIPLLARVFQIADIFDALLHARSYKPALQLADVLQQMQQEASDGRCDPYLMQVFLDTVRADPDTFTAAADEDLGADRFRQIARHNTFAGMKAQAAGAGQ